MLKSLMTAIRTKMSNRHRKGYVSIDEPTEFIDYPISDHVAHSEKIMSFPTEQSTSRVVPFPEEADASPPELFTNREASFAWCGTFDFDEPYLEEEEDVE